MDKFVFLDLDDTILDFHRCEAAALKKAMGAFGLDVNAELSALYSGINDRMWKLLERGRATRDEVLTRRFSEFLSAAGREDISPAAARRGYEAALSDEAYFIEGARDMLEALYGRYRLYIVSNGTAHVQDGRIAKSGIAKYFDGIFISHKIGFDKPDPRFFEYCFARIPDFDRRRAIVVGDSPTSDILGGKNAGVATLRYNPKGLENPVEPDMEIRALSELEGALERFFEKW